MKKYSVPRAESTALAAAAAGGGLGSNRSLLLVASWLVESRYALVSLMPGLALREQRTLRIEYATLALWLVLAVFILSGTVGRKFFPESADAIRTSFHSISVNAMNPNPFAWSFRAQYAAGALVCIALLAYAIFEQFQMGVEPCPKCIFQRIAFMGMTIFFLAGAVHGPGVIGRRIYASLVAITAAIGAVVAVRHLIVQLTPHDPLMEGCGPGLNYLLDSFPIAQAIKKAFMASGDCGEISWTFLGLTMPGWTLICFVLLGGGALWAGWRKRSAHAAA